jgi:hypothetical protein
LQFKKDKYFADKLTEKYKNALVWLIASYSNQYWVDKKLKNYPADWNEERKDNLSDNNAFASWFNDNFEVGEGFECSNHDFKEMFKDSPCKDSNAKDEIARMKLNIKYDYEKGKMINKKRFKGFWIGFKKCEFSEE